MAVLLIEPPRHKGIRGPAVFPQGKAALIVKQDCAADHIALIFLQNNTSPYIFVYNCQRERIIVPFQRTDDQAILRMWIKSASDTVYLCSFQKNGYARGHVLRCGPCFPQLSVAANLSYPAGFSDKRRPQFLRSASPQMGAAAAPIRGHASRCNSNAANRLRFPDSVFFLLFSIFTDGRLPE